MQNLQLEEMVAKTIVSGLLKNNNVTPMMVALTNSVGCLFTGDNANLDETISICTLCPSMQGCSLE